MKDPIVRGKDIIPQPSQCQINEEIIEHDEHSIDTNWIHFSARKL
jgi:hypothetical protein